MGDKTGFRVRVVSVGRGWLYSARLVGVRCFGLGSGGRRNGATVLRWARLGVWRRWAGFCCFWWRGGGGDAGRRGLPGNLWGRGGLRVIVMCSRWSLLRGLLGSRPGQDRSGGRRVRRWSCGLRCCVNRLGWVRLRVRRGCCGPVMGEVGVGRVG